MDEVKSALEMAAVPPNTEAFRQAEGYLKSAKQMPGFSVVLLQLILSDSISAPARQLAAILFKQIVDEHWEPYGDEYQIPDSDKATIKENGLQALLRCNPEVSKQMQEAIKTVIRVDWPERWPGLIERIVNVIKEESDPRVLDGALGCFLQVVRKYEYNETESFKVLSGLVEQTFPFLQQFLSHLIVQNTVASCGLAKQILKIFYASITRKLPNVLRQPQVLTEWVGKMLEVLTAPLPAGQPEDPDMRREWHPWKAKKWSVHIFSKLFSRYGDPLATKNKKKKKWANQFSKGIATKVLYTLMQIMDTLRQQAYLPDSLQAGMLRFLTTALRHSSTWTQMLPYFPILLREILFPMVCFSDADAVVYEEDPQEFVRKEYDIMEEYHSVKQTAMGLISTMVEVRAQDTYAAVMQLVLEASQSFPQTQNARVKEGALNILGSVATEVKGHNAEGVDGLLVQYVLPDLENPNNFLAARACWVVGRYVSDDFEDDNIAAELFKRVFHVLETRDLVARTQAALAMRFLVLNDVAKSYIGNMLPKVFDIYFGLMNEIDSDELVSSLEYIIYTFRQQVGPFALQICTHLTNQITRLIAETEGGDPSDPDVTASALAASECAKTLETVLASIRKTPELYNDITRLLLPFLHFAFTQEDNFDMLESTLKMLSFITFFIPTIPKEMWAFFPMMMAVARSWGVDHIEEMVPYFDNIISRDPHTFLTEGVGGQSYLSLMWDFIRGYLQDEEYEVEAAEMLKLVEVILQNCGGKVDELVPHVVPALLKRLGQEELDPALKTLIYGVFGNTFMYNPLITLHVLEGLGATEKLFMVWLQDLHEEKVIKRLYDRKLCILGMSSLLKIPAAELPQSVQPLLKHIVEVQVITLSRMNDQIDKRLAKKAQKQRDKESGASASSAFATILSGTYDDDDNGGEDDDDADDINATIDDDEDDEDEIDEDRAFYELARDIKAMNGGEVVIADSDSDEDDYLLDGDDDDDDEDETVTIEKSPVDDIDELCFFVEHLHGASNREPEIYGNLIGSLAPELRSQLDAFTNEMQNRLHKKQIEGSSSSGM